MKKPGSGQRRPVAQEDGAPIVVEGGWILRALALLVGVALVCGYLTLCGLFYQGQWQMVLHPVRTEVRPSLLGARTYDVVRFGPDATGVPQRAGWWLPAVQTGDYRHLTILYLPSGDGSLADQAELLNLLSTTGAAVFAIDWRAYGASAMLRRPGEASMREDAEAAWQYLVATRGLKAGGVIPYGRGLGAAVALWLADEHSGTPAMVLDGPRLDVTAEVANDPRVRLLPVKLLFNNRFELEPMLRESKVPKLIVTRDGQNHRRVLEAGDPKMTVVLRQFDAKTFDDSLERFLGQYTSPPATVGGTAKTVGGIAETMGRSSR